MLKRTALAILFCAATIPAALAADSSLLGLAPADSDVLLGINIKQIRESAFGKLIVGQLAGPDNAEFQGFVQKAGFNPLADLDEVLIAAPAQQKPNALLLIRGRFDAAKLTELAASGGMKGADYHGVQILSKPDSSGGPSSVALIDPTLVVGGDEAGVRAFVDRRGQSAPLKAALAARANETSKANDIWLVLNAAPAAFAPEGATAGAGPMGDLLKAIEQATLGVKFGSDIVISLQAVAHTEKDAQDLASAVRLFTGMAAASKDSNKQLAAFLQKLKVDSQANTAKVWLSIPEAEAEAALKEAMAAKKEAAKEPTPAPAENASPESKQ